MRPAIVETVMSQFVAEGRELLANVVKSEAEAAWHRVVLGRFLLKVRDRLPKRGTPTHGWGAFLGAIEMDDMTAARYIKLAEASLNLTERDKDQIPTYADLGLDKRVGPQPPDDLPPPSDDDVPPEADDVRPTGGDDVDVAIDRDTWCTPRELAAALGAWDLDPCSNERSHVRAARAYRLDNGEDGLELARDVGAEARVYINPPYSDVMPWVQAYAHARFCFLLKLDPSTKWFAELFEHTALILVPRGTRIQFEPPPGVPPEKAIANQFPHALFYARAADATAEIKAMCFPGWTINRGE